MPVRPARAYLHRFWSLCQFLSAIRSCRVASTQPENSSAVYASYQEQGGTMDELANRWYQTGSLLLQAGFLIAAVWSVRAILQNMRASQEQMGALLKLTVSGGASGEESLRTARPTPYLLDGWPEGASNTASAIATAQGDGRPRKRPWLGMSAWLQAPMVSSGISPWRRAVRWLQAPAGS